jgi:hypothetical protein
MACGQNTAKFGLIENRLVQSRDLALPLQP